MRLKFTSIFFSFLIFFSCVFNSNENIFKLEPDVEEDMNLKTSALIKKYGYPVEMHTVRTKDGFILEVHRIPHGKNLPLTGIPILLTHSLGCTSAGWINNLQDSLGFVLADEQFDVWLGNFRGNIYTRHSIYTTNNPEYWDFSFQEMADYDLTALIDYIRNVTGYQKILYLGISLGSLVGFTLFSSNLEYNNKVAGFVALGPVAYVQHQTSQLFVFIKNNYQLLMDLSQYFNVQRWLYLYPSLQKIGLHICTAGNFCDVFLYSASGFSPYLRNQTRDPVYMIHCVEGTPLKNIIHLKQIEKHKTFAKFDYGKDENLKRYRQEESPEINISLITVPVALFSAPNDPLANPIDVQLLKQQLKSLVLHEILPHPLFSHSDFMFVSPSKEILHGKILDVLREMWSQQ